MYIHELNEWPNFSWNAERLAPLLERVREIQAALRAELDQLGFDDRVEASLRILTEDVVKTSEIEGELLDPVQVRSSIARRLGLEAGGISNDQRNIEGIVDVLLDATRHYALPLTNERLYGWHALLFPTGYSNGFKILVAQWRQEPMDVVSTVLIKQRVYFTAPEPLRVPSEMENFFDWFEGNADLDPIIKAGIAHLYFVTIHPFDDGNGRIARAIADLALARADEMEQRFYSMSAQIRNQRKEYYDVLEKTQKSTLDITDWLEWFLVCLTSAIEGARIVLNDVLRKARIWQSLKTKEINARQQRMLNLLLDKDFFGALGAAKWSVMNKCSLDTANRDLAKLVDYGILQKMGQAKSTRYILRTDL
jgi:Fic family protein